MQYRSQSAQGQRRSMGIVLQVNTFVVVHIIFRILGSGENGSFDKSCCLLFTYCSMAAPQPPVCFFLHQVFSFCIM